MPITNATGELLSADYWYTLPSDVLISILTHMSFPSLNKYSFRIPSPDGVELTQQPMDLIAQGHINNVNGMLLGTTRDEDSFWLCRQYKDLTIPQYEDKIRELYPGATAAELLGLYHASAYPDGVSALIDCFSDRDFKCPTLKVSNINITQHNTTI